MLNTSHWGSVVHRARQIAIFFTLLLATLAHRAWRTLHLIAREQHTALQLLVTLTIIASSTIAAAQDHSIKRYYLTAGGVVSQLKPQTPADNFDLDKSQSYGGQLSIGRRLYKRWALELSYTDAGNATLGPTGSNGFQQKISVDYQAAALNLIRHWRPHTARFNIFNRAGIGMLDTQARTDNSDIPVNQLNEAQLAFGMGLDGKVRNNVHLRLVHDFYDQDAHWTSLSLMVGLGRNRTHYSAASLPVPNTPPQQQAALPVPASTPTPKQTSMTPLANVQSDCQPTHINLDKFTTGSPNLITAHTSQLSELAQTLAMHDDWVIKAKGHTDSRANGTYNMNLSRLRAESAIAVVRQLNPSSNNWTLKSYAFGEHRPVETNLTAEGRARNRRVELTFECGKSQF